MHKQILLLFGLLLAFSNAQAFETIQINPRVYALVGDLGQRSPQNLGHNMTSGFIVGNEAVAVIDSGASRAGAERIHAAIRKVSDKPIRWVVNTGGQDHRWLGNAYFREQGATVIASAAAAADMHERAAEQMVQAEQLIGDGFAGTEPAYPDQTFDQRFSIALKGIEAEVIDPRSLVPLDSELILASVRKTRRVVIVDEAHQTCNAGAEIAAQVADSAFDCLDAPVKRVSSFDCHIAYAPPLEDCL